MSGGDKPKRQYGDAFEFWWSGTTGPGMPEQFKEVAWEAWKASAARPDDPEHRPSQRAPDADALKRARAALDRCPYDQSWDYYPEVSDARCILDMLIAEAPVSSTAAPDDVPLCAGCAQAWFTERNLLAQDKLHCVACALLSATEAPKFVVAGLFKNTPTGWTEVSDRQATEDGVQFLYMDASNEG